MNVADLMQGLSYGELRNLFAGMTGAGVIEELDQNRAIFFANQALKHLSSRFSYKRSYVKLQLVDGRRTYPMRKAFAKSVIGSGAWLDDTIDEALISDVIKVLGVTQLTKPGDLTFQPLSLALNDRAETGVRMKSYDTLFFPEPQTGALYEIELQVAHEKLSIPINENEEINLPPGLEEALLVKTAAGFFGSMGGEVNAAIAVRLENRFETLCAMTIMEDLNAETFTDEQQSRLDNGFV
jgi:hypothetical protein